MQKKKESLFSLQPNNVIIFIIFILNYLNRIKFHFEENPFFDNKDPLVKEIVLNGSGKYCTLSTLLRF